MSDHYHGNGGILTGPASVRNNTGEPIVVSPASTYFRRLHTQIESLKAKLNEIGLGDV